MSTDSDPKIINWQEIDLPDAWVDSLFTIKNPFKLFRLIFTVFQKRKRVEFPPGLETVGVIPKYAQQEFHRIPNGNYSNKLAAGYINGFDRAMLGEMKKSRRTIATKFKGCRSVLDLGCGGGRTAQAIYKEGVKDIWGIDISPYLLKRAAMLHPNIKFSQAAGESLPFGSERFDAVCISYVLHEVPKKYILKIIDEAFRVIKPGGKLVLLEPSNIHYSYRFGWLFRNYGLKGIYFKILSHSVYEPFVKSWHNVDVPPLFKQKGFCLVEEVNEVPNHLFVFRKYT